MKRYNWVIDNLETAPSEDGLTDVVKTVRWRYIVSETEYTAEVNGTMPCAAPSEKDFTAYADLTEDQVIEWLESGLNVDQLKSVVDLKLENQKNPPIVNLPLPWASEPVAE